MARPLTIDEIARLRRFARRTVDQQRRQHMSDKDRDGTHETNPTEQPAELSPSDQADGATGDPPAEQPEPGGAAE